ncbi:MAG: hypothetical protein GY711_09470 [bacterium]|nr:hypothetical protein [bacterium]
MLPVAWFTIAGWFVWGSGNTSEEVLGPIPSTPEVAASQIDPSPLRTPLTDPPMVEIGGVQQRCSDCHAIFASLEVTPSQILQHSHIQLDHGLNNRCYNCHSRTDRDKLILHDETLIGFADTPQLCAQCHGTVYRDWERGTHGRTTGSWDRASGKQERLLCISCHDPHRPRFDAIEPLPGPNTWRMGEQDGAEDTHASEGNPLERWKTQNNGHPKKGH